MNYKGSMSDDLELTKEIEEDIAWAP